MYTKNELESMGFEFHCEDQHGNMIYWWEFRVGTTKQPTVFKKRDQNARRSLVSFSDLQKAINDAIVEGAQMTLAECGNCDHVCDVSDLNDIKHYSLRVEEDEPTPLGECPQCGALSHRKELLPNFAKVCEFFGLDTSYQYDAEKILKYSADFLKATQQPANAI